MRWKTVRTYGKILATPLLLQVYFCLLPEVMNLGNQFFGLLSFRLFTVLCFSVRCVDRRRAAILVSICERNWGERKMPVGSGGGVNSVGEKGTSKIPQFGKLRGFVLACVASVPVRSERNSGSAKNFFTSGPREKWSESKEVEGRGLWSFHISLHLFALAPFFARPECEELILTARISFASYGRERLLRILDLCGKRC